VPAPGGTADKLGNRYEGFWAIDQLLRIVSGISASLKLEPLDPDESRGIEFVVREHDGAANFWSVKRQTTKAEGWTLAVLASVDERGRSILGDLIGHVEPASRAGAVFASTLGARDLDELQSYAGSVEVLKLRLEASTELKQKFQKYVLALSDGSFDRAVEVLRLLKPLAVSETHLKEQVDLNIRKTFYTTNGTPIDPVAVRGHLAELLVDRMHEDIDRDAILAVLNLHGFGLREWATERPVLDRIRDLCDGYVAPLKSQQINGTFIQVAEDGAILRADGRPAASRLLVIAEAGGGKSTTLASTVEGLIALQIPVLPIRFDLLPEGILSTQELGQKLLLPDAPTVVLAGVAVGGLCVLVVDQLDAVSLASGRRAELWSLFESLLREANRFPNMVVIVGCRAFDLEHDHRMRALKTQSEGFSVAPLRELSPSQVDQALRDGGTDPTEVSEALRPILGIPLHLSMFLSLERLVRTSVHSRDQLFDMFWSRAESRTDQRLGRKSAWTAVIDRLSQWLSVHQQLSAPAFVLDGLAADANGMASEHVLGFENNRYRFFHETFFDYAFARRFAAGSITVLQFLLADEQHLFRRAQVRQILSFLRLHDRPRYLRELRELVSSKSVRFHIKSAVFAWLSSLRDLNRNDWDVLKQAAADVPALWVHIRGLTIGRENWFDVLDQAGFFEAALSSNDETREQEAIWMISVPTIMKTRSDRVAALLRKYRK
jgi:hypothetical protein